MSRLVLIAAFLLLARSARALPDLTPEIYGVALQTGQTVGLGDVTEGCAASATGNTLLRFGIRIHNQGPDAEVIGDPGCPDCRLYPGASCANPDFECSPADGHMHPHFESLARYDLLDAQGNVVAVGAKRGFCMRDDGPPGGGCANYTCTDQGITPGCYDDYEPTLGCQYIDATGVPGIGTRAFRLRVTVDPLHLLADADRSNDVTEVLLPGCGDGVLDPGEACEPGTEPCCDVDCHRIAGCDASCLGRSAGASCRPSTGPCDPAETCDGVSAACPSDARLADGAPCGGEDSACVATACRGGVCSAERAGGGCLVGGECFPAGAVDPDDPCKRCDPSRTIDLWSPNRDPDPAGIRCQVGRLDAATRAIDCPRAVGRAVARRLARAHALAARLARPGAPHRLARLAGRLRAILERGAERGCRPAAAEAEIAALLAQLDDMVSVRR